MKTSIKTLIFTLFVIFSFDLSAQNTQVYWLHGLNDTGTIWSRHYGPLIGNQRRAQSITPFSYETNEGVADGVNNLRNIYSSLRSPNSKRILVGHSMGGLIGREYGRLYGTDYVSGIITVGTPNQGAPIVNNLRNGNVDANINNAVLTLAQPALNDPSGAIFSTSFQFLFGNLDNNLNVIRAEALGWGWYVGATAGLVLGGVGFVAPVVVFFGAVALNMFMGQLDVGASFENSSSGSLDDLTPGSQATNRLNAQNRVPTATIITEEYSRSALRLAGSSLFPPEDQAFENAKDDQVLNLRNSAKRIYITGRIYNDIKKWVGFWNYNKYHDRARLWRTGQNYIEKQFEADYNRMIGSSRQETYTYTYTYMDCGESIDQPTIDQINPGGTDGCQLRTGTATGIRNISEPSDGLIPTSFQSIPGNSANMRYTALEVNHLEVGNHRNMTIQLNSIFESSPVDGLRIPRR